MRGFEFLQRLEQKGLTPARVAFGKEENIYRAGEPGISLFFLMKGKIALTMHTPEGKALGLAVLGPGDVFGELALTTGERYVTAHALTDGEVAVVRADETKALARDDPDLLNEIISLMGERLRKAVGTMTDLLSVPLSARLARTLLSLAPEDSSGPREVAITQEELAALLGATREAVNRQLRRLEARGWVELGRGRIVIQDPRALSGLR